MNNFDAFIPEIWSARVVEKLYQTNLALAVCANTEYEGEIRQQGDTVQVRTYGRMTTQKYVRNTNISYEALAPTKETLTINDADMFAFTVDDLDDVQADLDPMGGYVREGAIALDEIIDTKVFSYITSAHANNKVTSTGSAINISATATDDTHPYACLVNAAKALDLQNAPAEGRWAIVHPYFKSLLLKDTVYFIKGSALGDSVLVSARPGMTTRTAPGFLGQVAGFDVYCSTNLPTTATGTYLPFGVGRPIAYANQLRKVETIRLETTFATACRGLILHDGTVFTEASRRLGYIYSDNS